MSEKSSALVFIMFSKYILTLEGDRGQYLERWLSRHFTKEGFKPGSKARSHSQTKREIAD